MKRIYFVFAYFCVFTVFGQHKFPIKIQDFSDQYEAIIEKLDNYKLIQTKDDKYLAPYVIRIKNKKDGKQVLESYSRDLPYDVIKENNEASANIKELPYGTQSVLIYEDFNFDGKKDLALMSGYHSCYGGPAFNIYLAKSDGFEFSPTFAELGHNYCGMFHVNEKDEILHTMMKSGCCWHEYSDFRVIDNQPKIVKAITFDYTYASGQLPIKETLTSWENSQPTETTRYLLAYDDDLDVLVTFELQRNKKRVVVFAIEDVMYYALEQSDGAVEFYFPEAYYDENRSETIYKPFTFDTVEKTLRFQNEDALYTLYETKNSVGIKVLVDGKTYDLKGLRSSLSGSLNIFDVQSLDEVHWKNLKFE